MLGHNVLFFLNLTQSYFSVSVLENTVKVLPLKSRSSAVPPIDDINSCEEFNRLNFRSVTESPAPIYVQTIHKNQNSLK